LKGLKHIALTAPIVVLAAGAAWASEGGGEHGNDWVNFAFRVANFVIFIAIIYFAAGKKIAEFFKSRRYAIENELKDLDNRKADAEKKLKEVEKSITNIEQERQQILEDYRKQGEALKAAIIEKAKMSAAQIKAQAEMTAANEAKAAVDQIREELAELVTAAAQKVLVEKLNKEEHEKLIDKYLTKVVLN